MHISEKEALSKIRVYLNDAGVWSRFMIDQLIEDCMGPDVLVANNVDEHEIEWIKKVLQEQPMQIFDVDICDVSFPSCCDECSNNPKNGGSGICNCTLPYMKNPTIYTSNTSVDDYCMTATTSTGAYIFGKQKPEAEKQPKADAKRIAEAKANIEKYTKEE